MGLPARVVLLGGLLTGLPAAAMPGVYATRPGEVAHNTQSHVVVWLGDDTSRITVWADVVGDTDEYVLLIPMPDDPALTAEGVRVWDPWSIRELERHTSPRLAVLGCEDLVLVERSAGRGCGPAARPEEGPRFPERVAADGYLPPRGGDTESATYELTVLRPDLIPLETYLDELGFEVPEGAMAYLADVPVVALHVDLVHVPTAPLWPAAVQIRPAARVTSLPLSLGTLSSTGSQEVLLTALSGPLGLEGARVEEAPTACTLPLDDPREFAPAWGDVRDALTDPDQVTWIREFLGSVVDCRVCTADPAGFDLQLALANLANPRAFAPPVATRYWARIRPDIPGADAVFGPAGPQTWSYSLVVGHATELESAFPTCLDGWAVDPGHCPGGERRSAACRSTAAPSSWVVLALVALAAWRRR